MYSLTFSRVSKLVQHYPPPSRTLSLFISPRDLGQLIHKSIEAPDALTFAIFHGISDNQFKRLDIANARELIGYEPEDNAFTLCQAVHLRARRPADPDF